MSDQTKNKYPKTISEEDISDICYQHSFNSEKKRQLNSFLHELIEIISDALEENEDRTSLAEQMKWLNDSKQKAEKLLRHLKTPDQHKRRQFGKSTAKRLHRLFSPEGLLPVLSNLAPLPTSNDNGSLGNSCADLLDSPALPISLTSQTTNHEPNYKKLHHIMHKDGIDVVGAVLENTIVSISNTLDIYKTLPESKGGRKPNWHRRSLIVNLLNIYQCLGGKVTRANEGRHVDFCESLFSTMGLPTKGVSSDVPRAYEELQEKLAKPH
ncbi:MAG: hypothetical protein P8P30_10100 [Rickettsiales bacterium]|nr:hypothetical protein [Rickettsiales bacterium]